MTTTLITLEVQNRQQWRMWLGKHHATSPGVWLAFYKDHTGMKSILKHGVFLRSWLQPTGVTLSPGSIRPSGQKLGRSAFGNRLLC